VCPTESLVALRADDGTLCSLDCSLESMDFTLNPFNFDHEMSRKHKRMKLFHLHEFISDNDEVKAPRMYIPRPAIARPDPRSSRWFVTYIGNPSANLSIEFHREAIEFRKLFRIPYGLFIELSDWVSSWYVSKDCFNRIRVPVGVLLLAVFKIIGFGWTINCCANEIHVGNETLRYFYHLFLHV
jgi:hypothetical protein